MKVRGNLVFYTCYITKEMYKKLRAITEETKIPTSALIREGIDLVLNRYPAKYHKRRR